MFCLVLNTKRTFGQRETPKAWGQEPNRKATKTQQRRKIAWNARSSLGDKQHSLRIINGIFLVDKEFFNYLRWNHTKRSGIPVLLYHCYFTMCTCVCVCILYVHIFFDSLHNQNPKVPFLSSTFRKICELVVVVVVIMFVDGFFRQ